MYTIAGMIARLERGAVPDRRLDAEVMMSVLAPPGAVLCVDEDLDGWGIEFAPDEHGDSVPWLCAADVPYATRYLDAAQEVIAGARPDDAAAIMARGLRGLDPPQLQESAEAFTGRAARVMLAELLRAVASERQNEAIQAA